MQQSIFKQRSGRKICIMAIGSSILSLLVAACPGIAQETNPPQKATQVSPEARAILDRMAQAYNQLQAAQLDGTVLTTLPLPDQNPQQQTQKFTSGYQAPNKFRHVTQEGKLIIGSTGEKVYVYQEVAKAYIQHAIPPKKIPVTDLPAPVPQLLQQQNPSILFSILQDPIRGLVSNMREVTKGADVQLQGNTYNLLNLFPQQGRERIRILVDPRSSLVKRFSVEIPPEDLRALGLTNNVQQSATTEIDYTTINLKPEFPQGYFAWTPPKDATDIEAAMQAGATNLVGQAAPDFTLENLQGQPVKLAELKGQVVVLDFWATWCPPCIKSLPEAAELQKAQAGKGVLVFAVNLEESKDKVQAFLDQQHLNLPVLLDTKGEMASKYRISAIPEMVVIGKDGKIKRVFIGVTGKTYQEIREAVEAAKKE